MRGRYALIFERGAVRHRLRKLAVEQDLTIAADLPDLLLITEPGTAVLVGKRTAAVGRLWNERGLVDRADEIDDLATSDDFTALPRSIWGNFALFSIDAARRLRVYRDPSAVVGLFHLRAGDASVFVSDAEFASHLELLAGARAEERFLIHWLQYPFLKTATTGFQNVVEVLPGQLRLKEQGRWSNKQAWSPWGYPLAEVQIRDGLEAARLLKETAASNVPAAVGDPVLLQLSGGLDSSIVAACLHASDRDIEGVHFASSSADGDERLFADEVARAFRIPMTTILEKDLELSLEIPAQLSFGPPANPIVAPINRAMIDRGRASGRSVIVDGAGGDNLFCYLLTAAPVLDAIHGGRSNTVRKAVLNVAQITNASWAQVAGAAMRLELRKFRRMPWIENTNGLNPGSCLGACEIHPWLLAPKNALEGRREHVEALLQIHHFFDRRTDWTMPLAHPLMAQPLLEMCLRIPSWLWCEGGRDRAVARRAFTEMLPDLVLSRRLKGSLQGYFQRSFAKLRQAMREILLDGELRRRGMLDVAWIEAAFSDRWTEDEVQLRLSEMAALELWLASWLR